MPNTTQRIRQLHRNITWHVEAGTAWEQDPRHVNLMVHSLGVKSTTSLPLVNDKPSIDDSTEELLVGVDVALYQSATRRSGYIGQGRMGSSARSHGVRLRNEPPARRHCPPPLRVGRYRPAAPRAVPRFPYQRSITTLTIYSDTDHAGCARARKPAICVILMLGAAMLRSMRRGQAVVALSSG